MICRGAGGWSSRQIYRWRVTRAARWVGQVGREMWATRWRVGSHHGGRRLRWYGVGGLARAGECASAQNAARDNGNVL